MAMTMTAHGVPATGDPQFIPPYPARPIPGYDVRKFISIYRENLIAIFGRQHFRERLMHMRLLRTDVFVCNDPDLVQKVFTAGHANFQRKSPQQRFSLEPLLGDGLFVSEGETWQHRRRIVGPIVHASRISDFAPTMIETIEEWRHQWQERPDGSQINVLSEMAQLTAEIISRTVFGRKLGREYTSEIVSGFSEYQQNIDQLDPISLLGLPSWLPRYRSGKVRRSLKRVHKVCDDIIDRFEKQLKEGRADELAVIAKLFTAEGPDGKPLDREAIRNEAIVIFMAGHETTANTLAWAWYLVSQAPWVRAKLHAELDTVLGGRAPTLDDVKDLPYTRAIIEETLRLYPPVPLLAREAIDEAVIDGQHIPKGSLVLVAPWLLHRNPNHWVKPDHFVPERFDPRVTKRPSKYAYVPFAMGPRICPGLTFGLTEAILTLAALAQHAVLDLEPGHEVHPVCRLTLRPGEDLPMRITRRHAGAPEVQLSA